MKNLIANITVKPSKQALRFARQEPEELECLKAKISLETIAMLHAYMDTIEHVACYHKDNDDPDGTDSENYCWLPQVSPDLALRHAITKAQKVVQVALDTARGQWALRKMLRDTAALAARADSK
jgi:hypothetical protein